MLDVDTPLISADYPLPYTMHIPRLATLLLISLLTVASSQARNYSRYARFNTLKMSQLEPEEDIFPKGFRTPEQLWQSIDSVSLDSVWLGYNPIAAPRVFSGYRSYQEPNRFVPKPSFAPQPEPLFAMPQWSDWKTVEALRDVVHKDMVAHPERIEYAEWLLPRPAQLPPEDYSFRTYFKKLKLVGPTLPSSKMQETTKIEKIHWLHVFDGGLQFSQAYLSKNWYQGGNDYLALLVNFYWNVKLNTFFHPNLMFENTVSYKLGLSSTQNNEYHKYTISEDLFQWNMKAGFKAHKKWFYTITAQFKTQMLNSYPSDSYNRTAAFLSPGELNLGLGMTYSKQNAKKSFTFQASLAPASYNLKTCIDKQVDPTQFNIPHGKKTVSEIGSNAELTINWNITQDINLKSRFFAFTDYKYYMNDLETTLSFNINRFLSTQIYAHLRYDSSAELTDSRWKRWMLKEILSFGFAYHFQTKPK